jgi:endonuclease YncB( thermonuclease family)
MKKTTIIGIVALSLFGASLVDAKVSQTRYEYNVTGVYDGDTFYIEMPGLPPELKRIGVRVRGIDTAEMRGKCNEERRTAAGAKLFTTRMLKLSGNKVTLQGLKWDKYGGRVGADVFLSNGENLAQLMIKQGYARPYTGGKRAGWCSNG